MNKDSFVTIGLLGLVLGLFAVSGLYIFSDKITQNIGQGDEDTILAPLPPFKPDYEKPIEKIPSLKRLLYETPLEIYRTINELKRKKGVVNG